MIVETKRLILRPFALTDLPAHQLAVYGDPEVTKYLPGGAPWDLHETAILITYWVEHRDRYGFAPWAVIEKDGGNHVGHCGLMYIPGAQDGTIELMYALTRSTWGQGYATEAASASLRHGFESLGLERIVAIAMPENTVSRRVLEKIGMAFEGIYTRYYDAELAHYSITKDEFQPSDAPYAVRGNQES